MESPIALIADELGAHHENSFHPAPHPQSTLGSSGPSPPPPVNLGDSSVFAARTLGRGGDPWVRAGSSETSPHDAPPSEVAVARSAHGGEVTAQGRRRQLAGIFQTVNDSGGNVRDADEARKSGGQLGEGEAKWHGEQIAVGAEPRFV
jgi:hypothetical protein